MKWRCFDAPYLGEKIFTSTRFFIQITSVVQIVSVHLSVQTRKTRFFTEIWNLPRNCLRLEQKEVDPEARFNAGHFIHTWLLFLFTNMPIVAMRSFVNYTKPHNTYFCRFVITIQREEASVSKCYIPKVIMRFHCYR